VLGHPDWTEDLMATFDVDTNAALVAADLQALGVRAGARAFAVTRHHGAILRTNWVRRASLPRTAPRGEGTEGLRQLTGDYLRKITPPIMSVGLDGVTASVGTNHPGAKRLEFGWNQPDAIGRMIKTPPYPTAGPALDETEPAFLAAIAAIVD
jgi:hypothetical protein